jgi:hypothetical protein
MSARSLIFLETCEASALQRAGSSQSGWLPDRFPNYSMAGPHNVFSRKG